MSRAEILSSPVGEMLDMINCRAIENGAKPKVYGDIDDMEKIK